METKNERLLRTYTHRVRTYLPNLIEKELGIKKEELKRKTLIECFDLLDAGKEAGHRASFRYDNTKALILALDPEIITEQVIADETDWPTIEFFILKEKSALAEGMLLKFYKNAGKERLFIEKIKPLLVNVNKD